MVRLGWEVLALSGLALAAPASAGLQIQSFTLSPPVCRARRAVTFTAVIRNSGETPQPAEVRLVLPPGVTITRAPDAPAALPPGGEATLTWTAEAAEPLAGEARLELGGATETLSVRFLEAQPVRRLDYLPPPQPAPTQVLVGAHHCPLWDADQPRMWDNVLKHPERTPALGFYDQANPEVSDWETTWAVEHGISFFIYCWYRSSQGGPVTTRFSSAIHQGLYQSRYADRMKFTLMWENQSRGYAGVADEHDLLANLLPYWLETYFKHPSYLKLDGKPVLFIYRPEFLIQDLGGIPAVRAAFEKMRAACRAAGFEGLYLLGEYRGLDPKHLELMKQLGLDYTFAYCWHVPNSPTPEQAIAAQQNYLRKTQELGVLPQVPTVSQAWSGWHDEGSIWKLPPGPFESLLRWAKEFQTTLPANELGHRLLLLDNWNEWGEGHYLAPYREYGFGYLDAVRRVFSTAPEPHTDLLPEDIGRGPYDTWYQEQRRLAETQRREAVKRVTKSGADEPGLVAWWAFDEPEGTTVAWDWSGHSLGGRLQHAGRAPGIDGQALVCDGGCVIVDPDPRLDSAKGLTIEAWVRTDVAGQNDKWIANRLYGGSASSGFRLGLAGGRPCFAVPFTDWSHHLTADMTLPLGRWVHLAGTFDGETIRLYVDGALRGSLPRPGPLKPSNRPLTLGSYEAGHKAHFTGLLDEVKLYDRALSTEEIASHVKRTPPNQPRA